MVTLIEPPIRTALMNNPDGTPMTQAGAKNGGQLTIQKHWYRYWGACGDQINANTEKLDDLVRSGTHANRPDPATVSNLPDGALYAETDRGNVIYQLQGGEWHYLAGIMQSTQAGIPTDLGSGDAGFLCMVTDYAHLLTWSGSIWKWGPGEIGSAYFMDFAAAPGTGWHICDGSSVSYLKSDGTVSAAIILPNTNGSPAYRKLGSAYSNSIAGPSPPTFTGTALAAHHHQMPFSQNGANLVMNLGLFGAGGAGYTATISAALVGSSLAGSCIFTDSVSPGTPSGSVTLSGDPVSNFEAMQYFRM